MFRFKVLSVLCFFTALMGAALISSQMLWAAQEADQNQKPDVKALSVSHYLMGLMHDWNGRLQDAITEYEKASQKDPKSATIHLKLGADYARAGKFDEAIEELKKASELDPEDLQPHYLLALVYSTKQDSEKAAGEYETILKHYTKLDPKNVEVYSYLGELYYSQKKYDKAIEQFQHILAIEPKNADITFMLGAIYLDKTDRLKAVEYFKNTLAVDPEHEGGLNSLGYMYAEDNINLDEALGMVQKAVELSPENGAYLDSLGWVYFRKGMNAQALEYLQKASALVKDPVIFEHLGDVCYALNQWTDAENYWKQSLELSPQQDSVKQKLESLKKAASVSN